MKKTKFRIITFLISLSLLFCFAGCSKEEIADVVTATDNIEINQQESRDGYVPAVGENQVLEGEKPVLKILNGYNTNLDLNADVMAQKIEEITGYKVEWYNLASENPTQALLLDIASGTSYDLLYRVPVTPVITLHQQGALLDLYDLLGNYGNNILENSREVSWMSTTAEGGNVYAIPYEAYNGSASNSYGSITGGMAFNKAELEELGMEIPTNVDDLVEVCKAYKDSTGNPALTFIASPFITPIMYAYNIADGWAEYEGKYTSRVRRPEFREYIELIQMMYKEGYIDRDLPINNTSSAMEKFTTGKCLAYGYYMFWNTQTTTPAFEAAGLDPDVSISPVFSISESDTHNYSIRQTYTAVCAIPKNAENPEHAMAYLDAITQIDNFTEIFIGEEGVTYEIAEDGEYYPIFPEFDDYLNADRYVGIPNSVKAFAMWRARARKTEEMAELYTEMSEMSQSYVASNDYSGYAISVPEYLEYNTYLSNMVTQKTLAGIASNTSVDEIMDDIITEWEANGGLELEAAMDKWWQENKDNFEQ